MAYDEGLASVLRDDLIGRDGISEKKMFGGLCFLVNGNMLCGVSKAGAMFRVGKENEAAALAIDGAREMDFTGRRMGGFIEADDDLMGDDDRRAQMLALALDFVGPMPPK
ncbi:TfoX/Sxy family protein [Shimia biformata]|uniref:TfoX/Sxy family protein n=1 Tax=Shimia biformata TaxID=1294299 RepID=UPI00195046E7|nr:TfoX/Sxy family protein [Shimia biformata]